jgi:hypothetical protein
MITFFLANGMKTTYPHAHISARNHARKLEQLRDQLLAEALAKLPTKPPAPIEENLTLEQRQHRAITEHAMKMAAERNQDFRSWG